MLEFVERFLHRGTGTIRFLSPMQAVAWLRREIESEEKRAACRRELSGE